MGLICAGVDFEFETILASNGSDLAIIGDGAPSLGDEKLAKRRGVNASADFERWCETLETL